MGIEFMAAQRGIEVRALSIDTEADWDAHPRQLIKGLAKKPKRLHLKLWHDEVWRARSLGTPRNFKRHHSSLVGTVWVRLDISIIPPVGSTLGTPGGGQC